MTADVDEPVVVVEYDSGWPNWYEEDAAEITHNLGPSLRHLEHIGSTSVLGLAAKPIIDILVAPVEWPLTTGVRKSLEALGYTYLGESGVPGREYFRRRGQHDTNLAVVEFEGHLWRDNLLLRDYLRRNPSAALEYAARKKEAWKSGAQTLLSYSAAKASYLASLLEAARKANLSNT